MALITFIRYLKDAFLLVQIHTKAVFGTAAICAVMIVVLKLGIWILSVFCQNMLFAEAAFGTLLTTGADLLYFPTALIGEEPLWGTLCMVMLAPITTSCTPYAPVFAPICIRRPWLAYLVMASTTFIIEPVTCILPVAAPTADRHLSGSTPHTPDCLLVLPKDRYHSDTHCYAYAR